jgi:acyl carrier protein
VTNEEILSRITSVVAEVVEIDDLRLEATTKASDVEGWDSLAMVQIMVGLEREFGIRFRTGEMAGVANVGDLVGRVAERLRTAK